MIFYLIIITDNNINNYYYNNKKYTGRLSDLIPQSWLPPILKLVFKILCGLALFALNLALSCIGMFFFISLYSTLAPSKLTKKGHFNVNCSSVDYATNRITLAQMCILLVPNFYTFLVGLYFFVFRHLSIKSIVSWRFVMAAFR